MQIKVGDLVRDENWAKFKWYEVVEVTPNKVRLKLSSGRGFNCPLNNKWVVKPGDKPKPWLKVTPPQPEKRELQSAYLNGFNKEQLRSLGETLIEISKEMK